MEQNSARVIIRGSERTPLPEAHKMEMACPDERFLVTVRLRAKPGPQPRAAASALADVPPAQRQYLTRDELAAQQGADTHDIDQVKSFAQQHGLVMVEASAAQRSVWLSGTAAAFGAAFGTSLQQYNYPGGTYRGRTGPLTVPSELADIIEGVFGLDNRPQAEPHYQKRPEPEGIALPRAAVTQSFTPPQLGQLYNFPKGADGANQCIALIELGGGFRPQDLKVYFTKLKLPVPTVKVVSIDGARNHPTNSQSADSEVLLDIEVAAALAPKASIVVYFAPNTSQGFLDAINAAVHDNANKPSVISISWGGPESGWTGQSMLQFDQAFQAAGLVGVTVCCAAGDNGSGDGVTDGKAHVDFPASSPFALACGGTRLMASAKAITSEIVWNEGQNSATGGGLSQQFPVPAYQSKLALPAPANAGQSPGRGVPDVAGNADPQTGYNVRVDGQDLVIGGTSAVAPLWAGLVALLNQQLGHPVGFLNPMLYGSLAPKNVCRDIVSGDNGAFKAQPGWDACTGWGSPNGSVLLAALRGPAVA